MSEEGRDVKAAELEFLDIFAKEDEKVRKEMAIPFLKEFLKGYKYAKSLFKSKELISDSELSGNIKGLFSDALHRLQGIGSVTELKAKL